MFRSNLSSQILILATLFGAAYVGEACSTTIAPPADAQGTGGSGGGAGKSSKSTKGSGGTSSAKPRQDETSSAGSEEDAAAAGEGGMTNSGSDGSGAVSADAGASSADGGAPSDSSSSGGTTTGVGAGGSELGTGGSDVGTGGSDVGTGGSDVGTGGSGTGGSDVGSGGSDARGGSGADDGEAGATGTTTDPRDDAIAHGLAITTANLCTTCHQADYSGYAIYPNITPDMDTGIGAWTDDEIKNAILNGQGKDGSTFCNLMVRFPFSDEDASDVVAFLRSLPARSKVIDEMCPGHVD